jgi:hypothetical protein
MQVLFATGTPVEQVELLQEVVKVLEAPPEPQPEIPLESIAQLNPTLRWPQLSAAANHKSLLPDAIGTSGSTSPCLSWCGPTNSPGEKEIAI